MNESVQNCDSFLERLNGVLDGDVDRASLSGDGHVASCANCQARLASAMAIAGWTPTVTVPAGFTDAVLRRVANERHSTIRQRVIVAATSFVLAASVLIALLALPRRAEEQARVLPQTTIKQPIAEAREAIVNLTAKVADDTMAPAWNLVTMRKAPAVAAAESPLQDASDAAKAGLTPIVDTPRRALNLLFRDMNSVAGRKS